MYRVFELKVFINVFKNNLFMSRNSNKLSGFLYHLAFGHLITQIVFFYNSISNYLISKRYLFSNTRLIYNTRMYFT